ncbi:ubiquitin elongating factor core-domain-containing protein [Hyaloraphidium curvatum]|nr:ubiquitin elongating factor core-domain-containing protein [Hyaloraphidium curvatum]
MDLTEAEKAQRERARQKRLAKLQQGSQPAGGAADADAEAKPPKNSDSNESTDSNATAANVEQPERSDLTAVAAASSSMTSVTSTASTTAVKPVPAPPPATARSLPAPAPPKTTASDPGPARQAVSGPPRSTVSAPAKPKDGPPAVLLLPVSQFLARVLASSLAVSLEPNPPSGTTYLPGLKDEIGSPELSLDTLEPALVSRLSLPSNADQPETAFEYLAGCYARLTGHRRKLAQVLAENPGSAAQVAERAEPVERAREIVARWAVLALDPDMGDMVVQNERGRTLGPIAILDALLASTLPDGLLTDLISASSAAENLSSLFRPVFSSLSGRFRALPSLATGKLEHPPLFAALGTLLAHPALAAAFTNHPAFDPDPPNARLIEVLSLLGPAFGRLSVFPDSDPDVAKLMFSAGGIGVGEGGEADAMGVVWQGRNAGDVKVAWANLRQAMQALENNHHSILLALFRQARPQLTAHLLRILAANAPRGRLQHDPATVSSHGFLYAWYRALLRICEPFTGGMAKVSVPDPGYPVADPGWRQLTSQATRIVFDQPSADAYLAQLEAAGPREPPHFVTLAFHLALALAHLGPLSTLRAYQGQVRDTAELSRHVARLRRERDSGAWGGNTAAISQAMLARFEGQLDKMTAEKLASDAALLDPEFLGRVLRFLDFEMAWLLRVAAEACGGKVDGVDWGRVMRGGETKVGGVDLEQLGEPDGRWKALPEWMVEDVCEWYTFLTRYQLHLFEHHPIDPFVTFALVVLSNAHLVRNPYLKAKLVEVLFSFTFPMYRDAQGRPVGRLDGVFSSHPLSRRKLIEVLTRFYVDVEQTGMHSQFYDKFNIRYNISQILKAVWEIREQRERMIEVSQNHDFFVRFVNLLMNDTTFLLDESLTKLAEIRAIQLEMADPSFAAKPQQHRQEREAALRTDERAATSYLSLGNETLHMLQYLTAEAAIVGPFMAPEVVDRLAAMMDFNLAALVGPRCTELKVQNPQKYRFDPKRMLSELVRTYLHLEHRDEFVQAVARDGRSYHKRHFDRAASILMRNNLLKREDADTLAAFVARVESVSKHDTAAEEDLGEVPDEFLDPIMFTLMSDPVILPGSKTTVDRTTIRSHLLSDAHDPFNRQPLKYEDVIPNTELKQKIDDWKSGKGRGEAEAMDTTE